MAATRCVVVGDVVESRSVSDREALRERLETGVAAANAAVEGGLAAPFTILKGVDEVAGVLADPAGVDRALWRLAEAVHPTEIRFAVVGGEVDVGVDSGDVTAMDGPAFHEADRLLGEIRSDGRHVALELGATEPIVEELLAALVNLVFAWKAEWTERQAELVGRYRDADSMTAVAEAEGVTVQVVSKTLSRAGVKLVFRTENGIARGFEYLARQR